MEAQLTAASWALQKMGGGGGGAQLKSNIIGLRREKTYLRWFGTNKGTDHPAHPCSLIRAFVIRLL